MVRQHSPLSQPAWIAGCSRDLSTAATRRIALSTAPLSSGSSPHPGSGHPPRRRTPLHCSGMARVQMSVGNELAAELGNDRDAMLSALADRFGARAYLRGNELTLDGEDGAVEGARSVVQ